MARKSKKAHAEQAATDTTAQSAQAADVIPPPDELTKMFENLQRATPRDHNNFPAYLLDHTMIPPNFLSLSQESQASHIEAAQIPLSILEGYLSFAPPSTGHPTPIWSQLPHEPDSYFQAFRIHLMSPHRNLGAIQPPPGFTPFTLREAYTLYYWRERARAYDIMKPIAAARLRDQRILVMEDTHFQLGHQLLQTLTQEMTFRAEADQDKRPFAGLKSKELIDSLIAATELQRVALRLPAKGPKNHQYEPSAHASPDKVIREGTTQYEGHEDTSSNNQQEVLRQKIDRAIASDPHAAASLQQIALDILLRTRDNQPQASTATPTAEDGSSSNSA